MTKVEKITTTTTTKEVSADSSSDLDVSINVSALKMGGLKMVKMGAIEVISIIIHAIISGLCKNLLFLTYQLF